MVHMNIERIISTISRNTYQWSIIALQWNIKPALILIEEKDQNI